MILTIATTIIGMTAKIGHTGATCKNAIEITALTTSSEPETRETIGNGVTNIPTAKRDAMIGAKRDRPTVKGGGGTLYCGVLSLIAPEVSECRSTKNAPLAIPQSKSFRQTSG
jgi:hypothetical protein